MRIGLREILGLWLGLTILSGVAPLVGGVFLPGEELAMTVQRGGQFDIYRVDVATGARIALTHNSAHDVMPSWSPDGQRLVFLSNRESNDPAGNTYDLYLMAAGRAAPRRLTYFDIGFVFPRLFWAWSPDSARLVFQLASEDDGHGNIYILDVATGSLQELRLEASVWQVEWSPDGRQIVFAANHRWPRGIATDIYLMNTAANSAFDTTFSVLTDYFQYNTHPLWSPDGRYIAYSSTDARAFPGDFFVYDTRSGQSARLHPAQETPLSPPVWSPDGTQAVLVVDTSRHNGTLQGLLLAGADGTHTRYLTDDMLWATGPAWSPDGAALLFTGARESPAQPDVNYDIYLVDTAGGQPRNLTAHPARDWMPRWSPEGTRVAFLSNRRTGNDTGELYVLDVRSGVTAPVAGLRSSFRAATFAWRPAVHSGG